MYTFSAQKGDRAYHTLNIGYNLIVNIILTQFTPNNNKMHALDHQRLSHVHHIIITRPIHKLLLSIHDKLITNWHISHMH